MPLDIKAGMPPPMFWRSSKLQLSRLLFFPRRSCPESDGDQGRSPVGACARDDPGKFCAATSGSGDQPHCRLSLARTVFRNGVSQASAKWWKPRAYPGFRPFTCQRNRDARRRGGRDPLCSLLALRLSGPPPPPRAATPRQCGGLCQSPAANQPAPGRSELPQSLAPTGSSQGGSSHPWSSSHALGPR